MTVRNASKQAGLLERVGSLRTGRHRAGFLKGIHRACISAAAVSDVSRVTTTSQFVVLPRFVEVDQRELSAFVRNFGYLGKAASFTIGLRGGSDGFGFELFPKRDQPSLYVDVTDRERKLAASLGFTA